MSRPRPLRRTAVAAVLGSLLLATAACGDDDGDAAATTSDATAGAATTAASEPAEPRHVRMAMAIPQRTVFMLPIDVAQDIGAWERRGLDVEVINFPEPPRLHQAIAAGDADFIVDSGAAALPAIAAGEEMKMVATVLNSVAGFGVAASNDIQSVDDLAGATMGITGPNSTTDLLTQLLSEHVAGDPQSIKRQPLGGFDAQTAALARGDIDGFVWSLDGIASLEAQGLGHQVADFSELMDEFLYFGLLATPDLIENDPEVVTAMIEGFIEGLQRIRDDREYAIERLVTLTEFDPAIAESIWESTAPQFSEDGAFSEAAIIALEDALSLAGIVPEVLDRDAWLDESFVPVSVDGG